MNSNLPMLQGVKHFIHLSLHTSFAHLSVCPSFPQLTPMHLSIHLSLPICPSYHAHIILLSPPTYHFHLSVHLSFRSAIHPSTHSSGHLSVPYLFLCLPMCPGIHSPIKHLFSSCYMSSPIPKALRSTGKHGGVLAVRELKYSPDLRISSVPLLLRQ